jgi:HEPN domain-containing protein
MSNPDPQILEKVTQWLDYADEDLRLASHGLNMKSACPYRLIAYHAQQCAEKCIKAYLVYHSIDFPYTHNIKTLLKLCGKNADWAAALKDAEELTPYAITARYPGEDEEVTKQEAKKAIKTASRVSQTIREVLGQHGL